MFTSVTVGELYISRFIKQVFMGGLLYVFGIFGHTGKMYYLEASLLNPQLRKEVYL